MSFLRCHAVRVIALAASLAVFNRSSPGDNAGATGKQSPGEAAMVGIFYDLKQNPQRQPSGLNAIQYSQIMDEFLSRNWDETILNHYFRVSRLLYTTQIFIPSGNSDGAPQTFGMAGVVKPDLWLVHYKAQVCPPEAGTYRFVGTGDDVLAVAVNGKTVLWTSSGPPGAKFRWAPSEADGPKAGSFLMVHGDWITMKVDDVIDLDVIFGDDPGFTFDAFLMIEKKGATYAKDSTGHPILPIFQVAPYNTPVNNDVNVQPPFATGFPIWKSVQ